MSKVLAGTAFVLLGGATATGGVLLLNRGSKNPEGTAEVKKEQIDAELSDTLDKFKSTDKGKGCVKSLFPSLENVGTETDNNTNVDQNFFTSGKATTGCLVVNWDKYTKTEGSDNKWRGSFRFLWAVKGEKTEGTTGQEKGFMVFLVGKTPSTEGQQAIQWEGGIYTLSSTGSNGSTKWTAKKQQEITSSSSKSFKKDSGTADPKKFPQPGDQWKGQNNTDVSTFWGWMSGTGDLDKITSSTDSSSSSTSSLRAYWTWEGQTAGENRKKLSDWSKDWDTWWKEVFEVNKFKAKEMADALQGTWTQKSYTLAPPSTPRAS